MLDIKKSRYEGLKNDIDFLIFVFLNADKYIDENFISSINANLFGEDVLVGHNIMFDYRFIKKYFINISKKSAHISALF